MISHVYETAGGFRFGDFRLRQIVIQRRKFSFRAVFSNKKVDHIAVGGVYRHHAALFFHFVHQAHHLAIVDH